MTTGARNTFRTLRRLGSTWCGLRADSRQVIEPLAQEVMLASSRQRARDRRRQATGRVIGQIVDRAVKPRRLRDVAHKDGWSYTCGADGQQTVGRRSMRTPPN